MRFMGRCYNETTSGTGTVISLAEDLSLVPRIVKPWRVPGLTQCIHIMSKFLRYRNFNFWYFSMCEQVRFCNTLQYVRFQKYMAIFPWNMHWIFFGFMYSYCTSCIQIVLCLASRESSIPMQVRWEILVNQAVPSLVRIQHGTGSACNLWNIL